VSTDRDVERIVRSWMDEGVTALPDRVLDVVLDQIPTTPQRRAGWPARRFPTLSTYARIGLVAAAVIVAVAVGIGLFARPTDVGPPVPTPSVTPSLEPSSAPVADPLAGTWLAAEVTCEQEQAAIVAAGFTADQMTTAGWACTNGSTSQFSIQFGYSSNPHGLRVYDKGVLAFPGNYRLVSDTTLEVLSQSRDYCLTYAYAIDGDQLTIQMTNPGCSITGEAPLDDQVHQTAIFETSPFTRQP
jgi:hypothetical protein